jgi:hypothetical protein
MIAVEYSKGYGTTYPKPVEQVNAALGFVARNATDLVPLIGLPRSPSAYVYGAP